MKLDATNAQPRRINVETKFDLKTFLTSRNSVDVQIVPQSSPETFPMCESTMSEN